MPYFFNPWRKMDRNRVKHLIENNRKTLLSKENASINLIDLFEITEHVAREVMNDTTPVISCQQQFNPVLQWITFKEFQVKYPFLSEESLLEMNRYCPEFKKFCAKRKRLGFPDRNHQWHIDQKLALGFFLKRWEDKDTTNPRIMKKMTPHIDRIKEIIQNMV